MRKSIVGGLLGFVAGAAMLFGGTASASVQEATAPSPQTSAASGQHDDVEVAGWEYYNWYYTYANCQSKGSDLVQSGQAKEFKCTAGPYYWDLYVRT